MFVVGHGHERRGEYTPSMLYLHWSWSMSYGVDGVCIHVLFIITLTMHEEMIASSCLAYIHVQYIGVGPVILSHWRGPNSVLME